MYHTWFFQKRLASALNAELAGMYLLECFSQQKDELILSFGNQDREMHLKADFGNQAGILSVQNQFARAKRNSVNLFSEVMDAQVVGCTDFKHERSFRIDFTTGYFLIFKMHGSRSNVLLAREDRVTKVFRNNLDRDVNVVPSQLNNESLLDEELTRKLLGRSYKGEIPDLNSDVISICSGPSGLLLSLGKLSGCFVTDDPIEATNKYSEYFYKSTLFEREKQAALRTLEKRANQIRNYLNKSGQKLQEVLDARNPEEIGHLIMANMHAINHGAKKVILDDFYGDQKVEIKLNPTLTPQKNAENYYRKSKNKKIEIETLKSNLEQKEDDLVLIEGQKEELEGITDLRTLRKWVDSISIGQKEKERGPMPYHRYELDGWNILIGKNARSNDQLTQRIAKKNDLWLHAKDVSGSHVVIKERPGQNFPQQVIEKAAALAAYYSKRKTDTLCPVIYTEKKFVRKVKGAAPGQVMVDREQVVMVEPNNQP